MNEVSCAWLLGQQTARIIINTNACSDSDFVSHRGVGGAYDCLAEVLEQDTAVQHAFERRYSHMFLFEPKLRLKDLQKPGSGRAPNQDRSVGHDSTCPKALCQAP